MSKYRGYKKVHEDDHKAILKHPAGHELHISKRSLKPELKKQLSKLPMYAEGGVVEEGATASNPVSRIDAGWGKVIVKDNEKEKYFADGGDVEEDNEKEKYFADGGDVEEDSKSSSAFDSILAAAASPQMAPMASSMSPEGADALPESPVIPKDNQEQLNANKASDASLMTPEAQPSQPQIPGAPQQQGQGSNPLSTANDSTLSGIKAGFGQQQAGIKSEAAAQSNLGQQEQKSLQDNQQQTQALQAHYQDQSQKIQTEIKNVTDDYMNGHIDPNRFWNSKTDLGKFSTALGLVLGGLGASFTGRNPALDFLNKQIDNDIESQRAELGKKDNILNHLHQQFGDMTSATSALKAMQLDVLSTQLQIAAANAKGPLARASAEKALGQLQMEKAQVMQPLILRQAVMSGAAAGHINPSMAIQATVPKEDQKAAYEELGSIQKLEQGRQMMQSKMDELYKLNTVKNNTLHPVDTRKEIAQVIVSIKGIAHDLYNKTSDQELQLVDSAIPNLGNSKKAYQHFADQMYETTKAKITTPTLDAHPMIKNMMAPKDTGFHKK